LCRRRGVRSLHLRGTPDVEKICDVSSLSCCAIGRARL
jgi:hypothetical protein